MLGTNVQRHPRYATHVPIDIYEPTQNRRTRLTLDNISLGGAFVRELLWVPLGSALQVRIAVGTGIVAHVRAVHVLDAEAAARKGHAAGTGLMFEGFGVGAEGRLSEFVGAVAQGITSFAAPPMSPPTTPARGFAPAPVQLVGVAKSSGVVETSLTSAPELLSVWENELSKGRLFIRTSAALPLRSRIEVRLCAPQGTFSIHTEVVHQVPVAGAHGVGFQLLDLAAQREKLAEFVRGQQRAMATAGESAPALAVVLEEARRFFAALENGMVRAALGLPEGASANAAHERVLELKKLFSKTPSGASAPQQARLDAALRALTRVERQLAVREQVVPGALVVKEEVEEAPAPGPSAPVEVQGIAKSDTQEELEQVEELLQQAEVFLVTDMRLEARQAVAEALKHRSNESLQLRAMTILASAGDYSGAVTLGTKLVSNGAKNKKAWSMLLDLYESKRQFALAIRAAEALVRIDPKDGAMKQRLAKLKRFAQER